jgi:hypothetical protein
MSDAKIELEREAYQPGETLLGAVCLDPDLGIVDSVEVRVCWRTEGKGNTDRGEVRREALAVPVGGLSPQGLTLGFSVRLPTGPLSYDGVIVKVRWSVEARLRSRHPDTPGLLQVLGRLLPRAVVTRDFRLGNVKSPRELSQ